MNTVNKTINVILTLSLIYRRRQAGRTGMAVRDVILDYEKLLKEAGCSRADDYDVAHSQLQFAEKQGVLSLKRDRYDTRTILQVRLSPKNELKLFELAKLESPQAARERLAKLFEEQAKVVPSEHKGGWRNLCLTRSSAIRAGQSIRPFNTEESSINELLHVTRSVLDWKEPSMTRFVSVQVCGKSKRLEELAVSVEVLLEEITEGNIRTLEDLGITEVPSGCLYCGPLVLEFEDGSRSDLTQLKGPVRLSLTDLKRTVRILPESKRCVTVENLTSFQELTKVSGGPLLLQTSFPGSAVVEFLSKLPADIEMGHFGDSDPSGFLILKILREKVGRSISPIQMRYRPGSHNEPLTAKDIESLNLMITDPTMADLHNELMKMKTAGDKGIFEQESLGKLVQM